MKKILASLLVVLLIIPASITAFGATSKDVDAVISAAVQYAFPYDGYSKTESYNVDTSKYFLMHVKSGDISDELKDQYLTSVDSALEEGTLSGLGTIAMVLEIMSYLDIDSEDYNGFNLIDMFLSTATDDINYSPYNYTYAIEAAKMYSLDEFAQILCEELVNNYYTIGVGTDFWGGWGTSADDLSFFILALAPYKNSYTDYIEDAKLLLEGYLAEDGYGYGYGDSNTDSTAMALSAYSALGDKEKADAIYDLLIAFYDSSTGAFSSDYDPYYATADAIFGLEYYAELLTSYQASDDTEDINENVQEEDTSDAADATEDAADAENETEDITDAKNEENTEDIEETVENTTEVNNEGNAEESESTEAAENNSASPQTGNDSIIYVTATTLAAVLIFILIFKRRKTEQEK